MERPVRPETVQSSVGFALRARMRQYEIRSRQQALIQANADLEQFAHSASHDLREPIRSIGVYGDLLDKHYGGLLDERGAEFLSLIRSASKRMDTLLSDLLPLYAHASSISDEAVQPVPAFVPLNEALESLSGAIRESGAQIAIGEMPAVKKRESHHSQVFQNLIGNAIKYRSESERLRIEVMAQRGEASHWILSVADNGIGVPRARTSKPFLNLLVACTRPANTPVPGWDWRSASASSNATADGSGSSPKTDTAAPSSSLSPGKPKARPFTSHASTGKPYARRRESH